MRWFGWFREPIEPELEPGVCQCGHVRCAHREGKYDCCIFEGFTHEGKELPGGAWLTCGCRIYIRDDDDDDDGDSTPAPIDPEVEELKKMLQK